MTQKLVKTENKVEGIVINFKLFKKQKQLLNLLLDQNNGITETLGGGGAGGSKSFTGCLWIVISCLRYPGTRWLIGRAKLSVLKQTTLKTFFEVCQKCGVKEGEHYKYNQQANNIVFHNGSEIILKDLFSFPSDVNFDSLGSLEITGAFIDEANQVSEKAKNILMSRIRFKLDENNLIPKILMTCNPAHNWVYSEYYKKKKDGVLEDYKEYIQVLASDNPFISKHYIENLKKLDPISQKRLLYGYWEYESQTGLFKYDNILRMLELQANSKPKTHYITIDVARLGKDKTCIVVWNDLNVVEIMELERMTLDVQAEKIEILKRKYEITNSHIVIDADGVGGGLVDILQGCVSLINNSKPFDNENYQNLKTQLYFKLSEYINSDRISLSNITDDQAVRLTQELQIVERVKIDEDGKIRMTPKEEIKKKLSRSCDLSDAFAYRMYFEIRNKTWDYDIEVFSF